MIRIAICDDEAESRDEIRGLLEEYLRKDAETAAKVSSFCSGKSLLWAAETGGFDIYILDIIMPDMNGIDLGLALRKGGGDGIIVYLTSSAEYAVRSYDVRAFHYLLKPVRAESLKEVMDRARKALEEQRQRGITIRCADGTRFLPYSRIMYAELKNRSAVYALSDGSFVKGLTLRGPFSGACAELTKDRRFAMCGASYCVNLSFVVSLDRSGVTFKNGSRIALPQREIHRINSLWMDFWLEG